MLISEGDGRLGYPEKGPYDAIHVGAASPVIPQAVNSSLNKKKKNKYVFKQFYYILAY